MRQTARATVRMNEMRASWRLRAISETTRALAEATTDYQGLLETVADRVTRLVGDACVITLLTDDGDWLRSVAIAARDEEASAMLRSAFAVHPVRGKDSGLTSRVVRTGDPVLIAHTESRQLSRLIAREYLEAAVHLGLHSLLAVPLRVHGRIIGGLTLGRYTLDAAPFDGEDLAFATTIADHAALAISNARLLEGLQREVRERRRAEDEAKAFVGLVETTTDLVAMASFDGQILFVNAAGRALVGLEPDCDVRQLRLSDFHTDDGLSRAAVIRARGSWSGEGVLKHFKTGVLIPTQVSSFIARATNGEPLCFATVQRDLRDTKRLEAEFRQAQKMEAVGRLAGGVAHDFNNLLTVILSYGAYLAGPQDNSEDSREAVDEINKAGQRAAALTRQLLALSRQRRPASKILDLNAVLLAIQKIVRRLVSEDIELAMDPGSDLGRILADEGQVEQVILNLVVNAQDAMPEGGVLTLATKNLDVADAASPDQDPVPPGAYVVLSVTDTGSGIDEDARAHVFEPFFTTKAAGKGTGLGLSTVWTIVRQSGGHVRFQSAHRKGTTFQAYFPRAADRLARDSLPGTTHARATRGNERILLVEDDHQVCTVVSATLRRAGYEVIESSSPEEAARTSEHSGPHIELLLTDVVMPKINGRQLAERFLQARPAAKVLYVSGYTEETIGHYGIYEPGVNFLQKPITPADLLRTVREVLDS